MGVLSLSQVLDESLQCSKAEFTRHYVYSVLQTQKLPLRIRKVG